MRKNLLMFQQRLDPINSYNDLVFEKCFEITKEEEARIIVFFGRAFSQDDPIDHIHNQIYGLVDESFFDGLMISQTVLQKLQKPNIDAYKNFLPKIKTIASTTKIPKISGIEIENEKGLHELMHHLIIDHQFKTIVHVRGPKGNDEAEIRERIWRDSLKSHGLNHGPEYVFQGSYDVEKNEKITEAILGSGIENIDAIVCCNDVVAIRVMEDLKKLGFKVPEDIAVLGFDDIIRAQYTYPGLTTVKQPLELQTQKLFDFLLNDDLKELKECIATELVVRGSCGCKSSQWSKGSYSHIDKRIQDTESTSNEDSVYRMISNYENRNMKISNYVYNFSLFTNFAGSITQLSQLPKLCMEWFGKLGFETFALLSSTQVNEYNSPMKVEFFSETIESLPPIINLKEGKIWEKFAYKKGEILAALPLVHGQIWYGVLIVNINIINMIIARILQSQMAAILDRIYNLEAHISEIAAEKSKVYSEQEKMKALTILVSGVAHEVSTPIGIARTSNSYYRSLLNTIYENFENNKLTKSSMSNFLSESNEIQKILDNSLARSSDLLLNFRKVAIAEQTDQAQKVQLKSLINSFYGDFFASFKAHQISFNYDVSKDCELETWPLLLIEVFHNLATNTLMHAFDSEFKEKRTVFITANYEGEKVQIRFQNNGYAIPPDVQGHIFEPFFTTKRNQGGTGLGMHIVYNLVQRLKGNIKLEYSDERGISFLISLPQRIEPNP